MSNIQILQSGQIALKNADSILKNLRDRHGRAKKDYESVMKSVNESGVNDDLYLLITGKLKRYRASKKQFNLERSPITVTIAELTRPFVELEQDFDEKHENSMANKLKKIADTYATQRQMQDDKKKTKLRNQNQYNAELESVMLKAQLFLREKINDKAIAVKTRIDSLMNSINLENSEEIREGVITIDATIPDILFDGFKYHIEIIHVSASERDAIFQNVKSSDFLPKIKTEFDADIIVYQQAAVSRIPGLLEELQDIEIAKDSKDKTAVKILEEKRETRIESDAKNSKKAKDLSKKEIKKEVKDKIDTVKVQSNFDWGSSSAEIRKRSIKKKTVYEIELVLPAGVLEIMKFWVENCSMGEDLIKIKRWSIDRMIKFAEKEAYKNDNKIVSKYVTYKEVTKAKI